MVHGKQFRIHVDPGHGGEDVGAEGFGLQESRLTMRISNALATTLKNRGYTATVGPQTDLTSAKFPNSMRVAEANRQDAVLLCVHINSGGGSYGLVEYHATNPQSRFLAAYAAHRLKERLRDVVSDVKIRVLKSGDRGSVLLNGALHSAVLLEPLFIDNPAHAAWLIAPGNLWRLAAAYADACDDLNDLVLKGFPK